MITSKEHAVPSPQMQEIIEALWQRRAARASGPDRSLAEQRAGFAPAGQLRPLPDDVEVQQVDAGGVPAWWLTTPQTGPAAGARAALLYLHGGGYQLGSVRSHGPLAAELGRATGRPALLPEYRLAPEHPFPAAVEDTLAAWRWLVTAGGVDPSGVLVIGDSAGGALVLALLQSLRDAGERLPSGAALLSPFLDLTASGASLTERADQDPILSPAAIRQLAAVYLDGADPREPAASPLFGSLHGLPPLLIQTGGAEVLLSDSERLAQAADAAGVDVTLDVSDGLPHVYHGALGTPEVTAAIGQIAEFAGKL
jgi:epsilon-lactone hydrolase